MLCYSKIAAPVIPVFLPPKFLQISTPSIRRPWNLRFHPFSRLSSANSSTAMLHVEEEARDWPFKYNWIDGAETLEKYGPGGYHPIMIGDILHSRYRIVDKLGFGGYSTVWLAQILT